MKGKTWTQTDFHIIVGRLGEFVSHVFSPPRNNFIRTDKSTEVYRGSAIPFFQNLLHTSSITTRGRQKHSLPAYPLGCSLNRHRKSSHLYRMLKSCRILLTIVLQARPPTYLLHAWRCAAGCIKYATSACCRSSLSLFTFTPVTKVLSLKSTPPSLLIGSLPVRVFTTSPIAGDRGKFDTLLAILVFSPVGIRW